MGQGQGGPQMLKGWDWPSHGSCRHCVPIFIPLFNTERSSDISDICGPGIVWIAPEEVVSLYFPPKDIALVS